MHDLGTFGGIDSFAYGINASGKATGYATTSGNGSIHAFLYDGTMHDLGTLGGNASSGYAMNASGNITGSSTVAGTPLSHAFFYDGTMHDLGMLGGLNSYGRGINASGQIVGDSEIGGDPIQHAFIHDAVHGMVDLNTLINPANGWNLVLANAINDSGQITGYGTIQGATHGFLLTPVPEPSTLVLATFGFTGLAVSSWGRKCKVQRKTFDTRG